MALIGRYGVATVRGYVCTAPPMQSAVQQITVPCISKCEQVLPVLGIGTGE